MSHKAWRLHALVVVATMLAGLSLMACVAPAPAASPTRLPSGDIKATPAEGATAVPTEAAKGIPAEGAGATPAEGVTVLPAEDTPTAPPEVAVVEVPAEVRRVFDTVWAGEGGPDSTPLTRLGANEWRYLPAGGRVTTDNDGEGWVKFSDCLKIYIFQDGRLVKAACPKSDCKGGNVTCSEEGTAVYNNQCASQIIIQTPGVQIVLEGTWLSVTYLPDRQVTLVMVFEGQAEVQAVLDADAYTLADAVDVPAGYFWFSTPGRAPDSVAGRAPRKAYSFYELLPVFEELNLWRWIDKITSRADMDDIPYPAIPPFVLEPIAAQSGPPPDWVAYVVQPNDTLSSLAAVTGTSVEELKLANCLEGDRLIAGESIFLPFSPPADTTAGALAPTLHPAPQPVRAGDCKHYFAGARPILEWSYDQPLAEDEYFRVDIAFWHDPATWHDVHWVREARFELPAYLYDLLPGGRDFTWTVAVARGIGVDDAGVPTGPIVSDESQPVSCYWYDDAAEEEPVPPPGPPSPPVFGPPIKYPPGSVQY